MKSEIPFELQKIAQIIDTLGLRLFLIGARALIVHGVDIGRETSDWDLTINSSVKELRETLTHALRNAGFNVQWRSWGLAVDDSIHVDINYAPLTLDEEFERRAKKVWKNVFLPSLEDLVILKLMGRKKDIADAKRIASTKKLDYDYLKRRAEQAGLSSELKKLSGLSV